MSIYSTSEVYPSFFDEMPDEPTSCYNCSNDCMGIVLLMLKEGDSQ